MDARELRRLKEECRGKLPRAALVGAFRGGRALEPPEVSASPSLALAPLLLSAAATALLRDPIQQVAAGVSTILASYLAIYTYLSRRCFRPDHVRVVRTDHGDLEFLRRNKYQILRDPSTVPGDVEVYDFVGDVCLARDRRANAVTLAGPRGPVVMVTTGAFARLGPEELEAVLAHEEGHVRLRHTYKLLALLVAEYVLRVPLLHLVYHNSMILLALHMLGASLAFTAVLQAFEYEADAYAARKVGGRPLARALCRADWNGIVDAALSPLAARLSTLARSHPPTLDRVRRLWTS